MSLKDDLQEAIRRAFTECSDLPLFNAIDAIAEEIDEEAWEAFTDQVVENLGLLVVGRIADGDDDEFGEFGDDDDDDDDDGDDGEDDDEGEDEDPDVLDPAAHEARCDWLKKAVAHDMGVDPRDVIIDKLREVRPGEYKAEASVIRRKLLSHDLKSEVAAE